MPGRDFESPADFDTEFGTGWSRRTPGSCGPSRPVRSTGSMPTGPHRGPVGPSRLTGRALDGAHDPGVRLAQPVGELGVEVGRGLEVATGHEGGLEEPVASLHDALGLGVVGLEPLHVVARVPVNAPTPSACRLPRPMPDSLSQISRRGTRPSCCSSSHIPSSRSCGVPGRDHPGDHEPRVRST